MPAAARFPAPQLDEQLCFALYSASLATTKAYRPLLDALGLTYPQYLVMMVLWERDGLGVSEVGARLHLDSGTLTPLLKRLEQSGLLRRERAADDERRVELRLTPAGRALRERAGTLPVRMARLTGCSSDELARLRRQLVRLRDAIDAASAGDAAPDRP
jgi:DNA-binding MarR family transcriptional regulator